MSTIVVMDETEPDIVTIEDCSPSTSTTSTEDIVITMTTNQHKKKRNEKDPIDSECIIIGTNKRRKQNANNDDCKISRVSHDTSHDRDVLYVRTNKASPMRKEKCSPTSSPPVTISPLTSSPSTSLASVISSSLIISSHCSTSVSTTPSVNRHKDKRSSMPIPVVNHLHVYSPDSGRIPHLSSRRSKEVNDRDASLFSISSSAPYASTLDPPPWWTTPSGEQPLPTVPSNFTTVPLDIKSTESCLVALPLKTDGFKVSVIQQIQSPRLWRRYIGEVRLFLEERGNDANLNEKLLYHCSRTNKEILCSEGLDVRLSNQGLFGRGIYFSNKPKKCDLYGNRSRSSVRHMYACKVILGDVKSYPSGVCDQSLTREPQKPDGSYYDSVLGFMSVGEEYVIYNNYRAIPLYYIEYKNY